MAKNVVLQSVPLDLEDRALVEALARREKLTMSDAIRRAIRAYAVQLGVLDQQAPMKVANP